MLRTTKSSFRLLKSMLTKSTTLPYGAICCNRNISTNNTNMMIRPPMNAAAKTNAIICQQKRTVIQIPLTCKTVEDRIMLILNLFDKIENAKLTMDSDFFNDLGLDSLDFVELILAIEDDFRFEIPDGDSDRFRTPRDIYQYICDKCDVYE